MTRYHSKMVVKFVASVYPGNDFLDEQHVFMKKALEVNYNQFEDKWNQ